MPTETRKLTTEIVEEWIALAEGTFTTRQIWDELGIVSPAGRTHLRVILNRLKASGRIDLTGDGKYRRTDERLEPLDWQNIDATKEVELEFPFKDIGELVRLFPKAIIVIAGASNAGKTAMCYQVVALNMDRHPVDLYNNETAPEQMKERFGPLMIPNPAPFRVFQRYDRFQDVIDPDRISVIDYLDIKGDEFYLVYNDINAIWKRLKTGVAVIALQKPPGRDDAFGGAMIRNRASLYITLDKDKMKILKAKAWKDPYKNPNGMTWTFKLTHGIFFEDQKPFVGFDNQ